MRMGMNLENAAPPSVALQTKIRLDRDALIARPMAALRFSGRSRQQLLVTLFQFAVACFRVLQSAPLLSQAALQIANSFFELYRHASRRGR